MSFDKNLELVYSEFASRELRKDHWVVSEPFTATLDAEKKISILIPRGYLTDGASVPRIFWTMFPRWGKYGQAACTHDWLCEYLQVIEDGELREITRAECDKFFLLLMEELGIGKTQRTLMYYGVSMYRVVMRVNKPSGTEKKALIENEVLQHYIDTGIWK